MNFILFDYLINEIHTIFQTQKSYKSTERNLKPPQNEINAIGIYTQIGNLKSGKYQTVTMQFCLLGYFLTFIEVCPFVFSRITVNNFVRVQSGGISSSECSIDEFPVDNSATSAQMQCGLLCSSSDLCIGMEIIGEEAKQCRLLFGFDFLKSSHKT